MKSSTQRSRVVRTALLGAFLAVAVASAAPEAPQGGRGAGEAPYPASGWRPDTPFYLPGEEPTTTAGAPPAEEEGTTTTTVAPQAEDAAAAEGDNDAAEEGRGDADDAEPDAAPASVIPAGVYYILLPDGRLQRVNYQGQQQQQQRQQGKASYVIQDLQLVPLTPAAAAPYAHPPLLQHLTILKK